MAEYFSLLSLAPPIDRADISRVVRLACAELYRVEWRWGCLSSDGARMLCWYRAPDAEAVRLVLRQQRCAAGTVWAGEITDFTEPLAAHESPDRLVVDLNCGPGQLASIRTAACAALEAAGLRISRMLAARDGTRLICLVATADEVTVSRCLQTARLTGAP